MVFQFVKFAQTFRATAGDLACVKVCGLPGHVQKLANFPVGESLSGRWVDRAFQERDRRAVGFMAGHLLNSISQMGLIVSRG